MRKVACLSVHLFYQSDWRLYISYCRSCDVIRSHMPFAGEKPEAIYAIRNRRSISIIFTEGAFPFTVPCDNNRAIDSRAHRFCACTSGLGLLIILSCI